MTCKDGRFNTGNKLCSNDLRDLNDNSIIVDGYVNSDELYIEDRLGVERLTLAGIEHDVEGRIDGIIKDAGGIEVTSILGYSDKKVLSQNAATVELEKAVSNANDAIDARIPELQSIARDAERSADSASLAAASAHFKSGVFKTVEEGLESSKNREYFNVVSGYSAYFVDMYLNNNGRAEIIKSYPSDKYILGSKNDIRNELLGNPLNITEEYVLVVVDENESIALAVLDNTDIDHAGVIEKSISGKIHLCVIDENDRFSFLANEDGFIVKSILSKEITVDEINHYTPSVFEKDGDIYEVSGGNYKKLTEDGSNTNPRHSGSKLIFLSSRRDMLAEYTLSSTGNKERYYPDDRKKFSHILITGQSLAEGGANKAISIVPKHASQAWKFSGNVVGSGSKDLGDNLLPLCEENFETIGSGFGNKIINDGVDREIIVSGQAWGGKNYSEVKKGGDTGVYEKCVSQAILSSKMHGGSYVPCIFVVHGEADGWQSNNKYAENLREWLDDFNKDIRDANNQVEPIIMLTCQTSSASGYKTLDKRDEFTTPFLQLEANNNNPDIFLVCPKYQYQYKDHAHILAEDTRHLGEMYAKVFDIAVTQGKDWQPLKPIDFNLDGKTMIIKFNVPVGNLVLDTDIVKDPGNFGFNIISKNSVTITNVELSSANEVKIYFSDAVDAGSVLSYAFHNGTDKKSGRNEGARGCLRDSDSTQDENGYMPLYNWCVTFKYEIK